MRSQQDHHVLVTFEEGTRQRRVACLLLQTKVGTLGDQQLRHLLVVLLDRWKQRRHAGLVLRIVDVGALVDQQLGDRSVAGIGRRVQGREAAGVAAVDRGALLDQKLGHLLLPRQDRKNQRCLASVALRVDFRPFAEQDANLLDITRARGVMQRPGGRESCRRRTRAEPRRSESFTLLASFQATPLEGHHKHFLPADVDL